MKYIYSNSIKNGEKNKNKIQYFPNDGDVAKHTDRP